MTAAVDGANNRFSQHQQMTGSRGMNPHSAPFNPAVNHNMQAPSPYVQSQALQMQLMQLEIMRLQTIQAQQYQSELLAQAQRQQQSRDRRASVQFNPPATAGPITSTFDLRAATLSAQSRRAGQADHPKPQLGVINDDQVPMTAGLGGKFGSRLPSISVNGAKFGSENDDDVVPPTTLNQSTTVISGGISLGNLACNNGNGSGSSNGSSGNTTPSKSDSAVSWRRGGNNNSVLSGSRAASSCPNVRVTPPPSERVSPHTTSTTATKLRPQPLRFNIAASQSMVDAVTIETDTASPAADTSDDASSTGSSIKSGGSVSSPTTPHSSSSSDTPLSPREEAAKKLYEGLGIGRPAPIVTTSVVSHRMASQPMRQPRGPPSGADELGPKNFATRIRRKAIGGLGALMAGRERRELVDAF